MSWDNLITPDRCDRAVSLPVVPHFEMARTGTHFNRANDVRKRWFSNALRRCLFLCHVSRSLIDPGSNAP